MLHAVLAHHVWLAHPMNLSLAPARPTGSALLALHVWLAPHISQVPALPWSMQSVHPAQPVQLAAPTSHLLVPPLPILYALPVLPVLLAAMLVLLAHPLQTLGAVLARPVWLARPTSLSLAPARLTGSALYALCVLLVTLQALHVQQHPTQSALRALPIFGLCLGQHALPTQGIMTWGVV